MILLAGLSLCLAVGCKRDKCKRVICVYGSCLDGTCICDAGYYGDECSDVVNAGLDGDWSLEEDCTAGADAYTVTVGAVADDHTTIWMQGLWEQQDSLLLEFGADATALTLSRQGIGTVEVDGIGTLNAGRDEITLQYNVYQIGSSSAFDQCAATLAKN